MKYLILICLLAAPAFAHDDVLDYLDSDVVYIIDITPQEYVPPEPVDVSVDLDEYSLDDD